MSECFRKTPTVPARTPAELDEHLGKRLRLRRNLLGVRQAELAEKTGISFQQLQKYETGENKLSASRLFDLATHLNTTVGWFFADLETPGLSSAPKDAHVGLPPESGSARKVMDAND